MLGLDDMTSTKTLVGTSPTNWLWLWSRNYYYKGKPYFLLLFVTRCVAFFPLFFVHKWQYKRENMCFVIVFGLCVDHGYIALKILWCTLNTLFEINSLFPWFYDCVGVDVYIVISYIAIKMEWNSALTIF